MAHAVETMAFAHQVPWHGLGTQVSPDLTDEEMLKAAGLDWRVAKRPLLYVDPTSGKHVEIPNKRALVRETDGTCFDVVGENWKPVQNAEALKFFRQFVEAGEATMETAGSLNGGKTVWGLANLNSGFVLPGGDEVKGFLLLASNHVSGKSTLARVTPTRVVCANTLAIATAGTARFEARFSHRYDFDPITARDTMGLAREEMVNFAKQAEVMQKTILSREEAILLLAPVYAPQLDEDEVVHMVKNPEAAPPTIKNILSAAVTAPGATPGTAWGLLNGVTYWTNHVANTNADKRLTSAWVGREAHRQERVMEALVKLAA